MIKLRIKTNIFALVAVCCALSTLLPTESLADLNHIICKAARRGCLSGCTDEGAHDACYQQCNDNYFACLGFPPTPKQQTPPPPCRGIHCTLRNPHPPTTVGPPTHKPRPVQPVNPSGVSNPNKTTNAPVILDRKNDSGGGHGRGH